MLIINNWLISQINKNWLQKLTWFLILIDYLNQVWFVLIFISFYRKSTLFLLTSASLDLTPAKLIKWSLKIYCCVQELKINQTYKLDCLLPFYHIWKWYKKNIERYPQQKSYMNPATELSETLIMWLAFTRKTWTMYNKWCDVNHEGTGSGVTQKHWPPVHGPPLQVQRVRGLLTCT